MIAVSVFMLKKNFKKSLVKVCRIKKWFYICISKLSNQLKKQPMRTQEIKAKGLKWSSGNGCELYVVVKLGGYEWWMISEKTGTHMVQNKGKYGQAYACDRVLAHWDGFKKNQNR